MVDVGNAEGRLCIGAVEKALAKSGTLEIFSTGEGRQFTSTGLIKVLATREIRISMGGKHP